MRAVPRSKFIAGLESQSAKPGRLALDAAVAESICDDLVSKTRWRYGVARAKKYGLLISQYNSVWSTFDPSGRPYGGLGGLSGVQIACDLGLDDATRVDETDPWTQVPMLLIEYDPGHTMIRFPTFVEAWSSDPPNYYFQIAPAKTPWAETRPWRSPPAGYGPSVRPEVVHFPTPVAGVRSRVLERW